MFNTSDQYGAISKFFHWLVFFLVLIMLFLGYFMGDIPDKIAKGVAINMHKLIGLAILMLMILRATWALVNTKPLLPLDTKMWERWSERSVHFLLYFALICMPIAGWVGSIAGGRPPRYGKTLLSLPIEPSKKLSDFSFTLHNTLAIVIIVLVSIHILAALYHYFIKKDKVLQRIWP